MLRRLAGLNTRCWAQRRVTVPRSNHCPFVATRFIRSWTTFNPYSKYCSTLDTKQTKTKAVCRNLSTELNSETRKKKSFLKQFKQNRWTQLVKFELSALVVVTSGGGYVLSGGSLFEIDTLLGLLVGTSMCASSAATFNQVMEIPYDKQMKRTQKRPLVTGAISKPSGILFGTGMGVGGAGMLWLCCNPATAALGAGTILLYCGAYTPLKRVTRFNTEVGAVVGAIPPVMGWTAAFGGAGLVSVEACLLAGTLFAWQMHHFMTIAWRQRADYATAGYVMMSLNDPTGLRTAKKGLAWCALMAMLPFVTCLYGITLPMFMVTGGAVNAAMFVSFYRFYQDRTNHNAYKAQIAGFLQLVAFLVLMVFHLKERNNITAFQQLMYLSSVGNDYCVHRYAEGKDHLCVVVFGKKTGESLSDTMDEVEQSVKSVEGLNKGPAIAMDGSHES